MIVSFKVKKQKLVTLLDSLRNLRRKKSGERKIRNLL